MLTTRRPIDMLLGVNLMKKGKKRAKNAFGAKASVANIAVYVLLFSQLVQFLIKFLTNTVAIMRFLACLLILPTLALALAEPAFAQDAAAEGALSGADTAWMLISTALVLLMTPALAFFYGGLVRSKNTLNTMMMSVISLGVAGVLWALFGYSLAFGDGIKWIGDFSMAFLNDVSLEPDGSIPSLLFMAFQGTFFIITAALISGAVVERMRFRAYLVFISLWGLLVYAPICHWVWSGNAWLGNMGALDFAGGAVVHINAGVAAVVAALVLGRAQGLRQTSHHPAQRAVRPPGRRAALVRLVRIQWGERPRCGRHRGPCPGKHHAGAGSHAYHMDHH